MKRKLKKWVLPTLYVLIITVSFISVSIINNMMKKDITDYNYSKPIMKEVTEEVIKEVKDSEFVKPYISESVNIKTTYYNKDDTDENQQNSLILYQNTYMPSTGVIYSSENEFEIISVYDGTVTNIYENELLGTVVEVSHNTNLTTIYYSLTDLNVNKGDEIKKGTILGKAAKNKIDDSNYNFLFEVYYNGKSMNPETFYLSNPNELQ